MIHWKNIKTGLLIMISFFFSNAAKTQELDSIHINLSGTQFEISIPKHNSREFEQIKSDKNINIWDMSLYPQNDSLKTLRYVWDYNGSWIQGRRGILMMAVFIEHHTDSIPIEIGQFEAFYKTVLTTRLQSDTTNIAAETFDTYISPKQTQWLCYQIPRKAPIKEYALALTTNHVLRISFEIMPTGTGRETGWLDEVETDIDSIMKTIQLQ